MWLPNNKKTHYSTKTAGNLACILTETIGCKVYVIPGLAKRVLAKKDEKNFEWIV